MFARFCGCAIVVPSTSLGRNRVTRRRRLLDLDRSYETCVSVRVTTQDNEIMLNVQPVVANATRLRAANEVVAYIP